MSKTTPSTWDAMLYLRGDRDLQMYFTDKNGVDWTGAREIALTSWQAEGYLLLLPQPSERIYPQDVEVWEITFSDALYVCKRLI